MSWPGKAEEAGAPGLPDGHPDGETRCCISSFSGGFCTLAWNGFCCCCSKGFRAGEGRKETGYLCNSR